MFTIYKYLATWKSKGTEGGNEHFIGNESTLKESKLSLVADCADCKYPYPTCKRFCYVLCNTPSEDGCRI